MFLHVVIHGFTSSAVLLLTVSPHLCLHTAARSENSKGGFFFVCFLDAKLQMLKRACQITGVNRSLTV